MLETRNVFARRASPASGRRGTQVHPSIHLCSLLGANERLAPKSVNGSLGEGASDPSSQKPILIDFFLNFRFRAFPLCQTGPCLSCTADHTFSKRTPNILNKCSSARCPVPGTRNQNSSRLFDEIIECRLLGQLATARDINA